MKIGTKIQFNDWHSLDQKYVNEWENIPLQIHLIKTLHMQ